ncbi:MAG: hypothetical protein BGO11_04160 [Solirubrobacterales bacterium 70-9]|nr:MAG: hypothetical protein BGO11_04160 [Solirubrobacterales bacterium 70-9]
MMTETRKHRALIAASVFVVVLATAFTLLTRIGSDADPAAAAEANPCAVPVTNKIACENSKPGDPPANWQIIGIGDEGIQGYATAMSTPVGGTVNFKIKTTSNSYRINILRLGYYGGDGARIIAEGIKPSATLPQTQPECMHEETTGLIDCGNWSVSASWKVPAEAVSGLYMAQLIREDSGNKGGESQIFFDVTEPESHAPIVLQTSDSTWQAYNAWGGNSLYSCTKFCPKGEPEAYKAAYSVSYNRPFDGTLAVDDGKGDPFYAEYQMIRWLEKQGYNMTYVSQPEVSAGPGALLNHKVFISSGHDEYWTAGERAAVEAARDTGVNLAFFTGNEVYWKTRFGPSIDSSKTPSRTLTTYKETHFNEPIDPEEPKTATSTWQDPRFKSGGAGNPPNALTGQQFLVNSGTADIKVPGTFAGLRFWKNTAVEKLTPTQTLTLSPGTGTLGYEWDVDQDNGFRPAGRIPLSSTTVNGLEVFTDYGTRVEEHGIATHSLSLYRAPSGALVFGAGTVQWSWGLDKTNAWDGGSTNPAEKAPDPNMEQATVNLLAEMGAQPATLQSNLVPATESSDHTPPTATVTSPTSGAQLKGSETVTISGTAADTGGGVVAGVEVSTDGGATWHPATGTTNWTYAWNVEPESSTKIQARAIDDSANIGKASSPVEVAIACPCSMLGARTPTTPDAGDNGSITVGVKFRSDVGGTINGIRFYKATANTGTHVGSLWTASGQMLGEATFKNETTSGWQQVEFASPVQIQPNTVYVAAYFAPNGHYSDTAWQMSEPPAVGPTILNQGNLHFLKDTEGGNGLYEYGSTGTFPTHAYHADNYWVDVLFTPKTPPLAPGAPASVSATTGELGQSTVKWTAPPSGGVVENYKLTPYIGSTAQTSVTVPAGTTEKVVTGLTGGTTYTFVVSATNEGGTTASSPSAPVTPTAATVPGAPTEASAKAGATSATVTWTAPSSNGGSPITGYKVTPYLNGTTAQTPVSAGAGATSATVSSLTAGSSYTFTVLAVNAVGNGPESTQSNSVVPFSLNPAGAPTGVVATGKSAGALLTWKAPASDGGSPITAYRITPILGGVPQTPLTTGSAAVEASITGLTNNTAYTFKVAAITSAGAGAESEASNSVTPYDTVFDLATPGTVDGGDGGSVELGVKIRSSVSGTINGVRFYKAATNVGTHVGSLWTMSGQLLAEATFTNESASGWQQVTFATPVQIEPNTTYVAGYLAPNGHYSVNGPNLTAGIVNGPLTAESDSSELSGTEGNGLFAYGSGVTFPTQSYNASNYFVDVLFTPEPPATIPGAPGTPTATAGLGSATVKWAAPTTGSKPTNYTVTPFISGVAQTASAKTVTGNPPATETTVSGLKSGTSYTFKVKATNAAGTGAESAASNAVSPTGATLPGEPTEVAAAPRNASAAVTWKVPASDGGGTITSYKITPYLNGTTPLTATTVTGATTTSATVSSLTNGQSYTFKVAAVNAIGTGTASAASGAAVPRVTLFEQGTPGTVNVADSASVVLGMKFQTSTAGKISGIRFYKSAGNTGTHMIAVWSSTGTLLASASVTGETASGWQEQAFATPVSVAANTTYVAGYLAPKGHYSATSNGFSAAIKVTPLTGLANSTSANGLYTYSSSLVFPTSSYNSTNYFVDVMYVP